MPPRWPPRRSHLSSMPPMPPRIRIVGPRLPLPRDWLAGAGASKAPRPWPIEPPKPVAAASGARERPATRGASAIEVSVVLITWGGAGATLGDSTIDVAWIACLGLVRRTRTGLSGWRASRSDTTAPSEPGGSANRIWRAFSEAWARARSSAGWAGLEHAASQPPDTTAAATRMRTLTGSSCLTGDGLKVPWGGSLVTASICCATPSSGVATEFGPWPPRMTVTSKIHRCPMRRT